MCRALLDLRVATPPPLNSPHTHSPPPPPALAPAGDVKAFGLQTRRAPQGRGGG